MPENQIDGKTTAAESGAGYKIVREELGEKTRIHIQALAVRDVTTASKFALVGFETKDKKAVVLESGQLGANVDDVLCIKHNPTVNARALFARVDAPLEDDVIRLYFAYDFVVEKDLS